MPPSGFSSNQAIHVERFLTSCCEALEQESLQLGEKISEALCREIQDIDEYIEHGKCDDQQVSLLRFVRAFYGSAQQECPQDIVEFRKVVARSLEGVKSKILAIHIESRHTRAKSVSLA